MTISRREFVHAGCAAAAVTLAPHFLDQAKAGINNPGAASGGGGGGSNVNRVTINVPTNAGAFLNLSKGWTPTSPNPVSPANLNASGYPTGVLGASSSAGITLIPNYYGEYVHSFLGTGSMFWGGQTFIIYNGGTFVGLGGNTGIVANGNMTVSGAAANISFKIGSLVTGISGGSGSLVTITTASTFFGSGFTTGLQVSFANNCSSNLVNGPNSDGSWTITNVSATQFTLNGSTGVVSPTVNTSGTVGTNTDAVIGVSSTTLAYNASTFTTFSGLVICTAANATNITNGLYWDPVFVSQLQALKGTPSGVGRSGDFWLRFMDLSAVQGSFECDFSQRLTPASAYWGPSQTPAAYYAGAATNGGASGAFTDLYSCASNPSNSPASGAPIDCEIVQANIAATNSGGFPGLTISGRSGFGNWPIFNGNAPFLLNITSGPASAGLSLVFHFTATWLNGGSLYSFTYVTVAGDVGNQGQFQTNLQAALAADATLSAGNIVFFNSGHVFWVPQTGLAGVLTVTYTSGPAILTVGTLATSTINTGVQTFAFSALAQAFVYVGNFAQSIPLELIVDLCNRVSANCWYNWPIYTKAAYITAATNFIGSNSTGITSGLKFGAEMGNEIWNTGAALWARAQCYGIQLGIFAAPYSSNQGPYGWQGLRTVQYATLSIAAWAAQSRTASQHYILTPTATFDTAVNSNFDIACLKGTYLVTSNSNFANYAGIGGTTQSTSLNTSGNRPADISTAIGCAPYWSSPWMFGDAATIDPVNGTVTQNAPMLQASLDYANGLTTTAFTELTNQFNGTTTRSGGNVNGTVLSYPTNTTFGPPYAGTGNAIFPAQEAQAAQYDTYRSGAGKTVLAILDYEGGPQWGTGANFNAGVNSSSSLSASLASADITALANQITALSWNVSAYTVSGTNSATEAATQILQMTQGWKYDTDHNGTAVNTGSYKNFIKTFHYAARVSASPTREVHPAQYGYTGSQWGFGWQQYNTGGAFYQNYNAITEFNT